MPPRFLHPFSSPSSDEFISIVRGEGASIFDADGTEYIDAMASLWYCNVGYGQQSIADAAAAQMTAMHAYSCFDPFTNDPADAVADRIASLTPMPDARVFLGQSGSESVDQAMKLARLTHVLEGHPERALIVSRDRGYHGTNYGGTSAQGIGPNRQGYGPLVPDVIQVPADDIEAMSVLMADRGNEIAAVITEPVQGAGGVWPPSEGYLSELRRLCDQHGALLIFDEVITGFGRLGTWFAAEHFGVTPDLTTFAKAVTSGYLPLGGVIVGSRTRAALESDPSFILRTGYTYSGHAACCAAAVANLDLLAADDLIPDAARRIESTLGEGLRALADDGTIAEVRGLAGVWAAGLREDQDAAAIRDTMRGLGVITRAIGTASLTFCPPLVITDEQLGRVVDALASACR